MKFNESGFEIQHDFFSSTHLDVIEKTLCDLYFMQSQKIKEYKDQIDFIRGHGHQEQPVLDMSNYARLSRILDLMEEKDKEALYQVQKLFPSTPWPLAHILPTGFLFNGPGLFINRPNTSRLLYKWHSEEHYYPKRRTFFNVWFPLFTDKTKENGTMSFKVGSHLRTYPFLEYHEGPNRFIQYEIPDNFLKDFEEYHCEVKRGDLVLFHSNLVHRSNVNTSSKYSFAMVARIWNPANDLTLSGDFCATPYGGDIGREGMVVEP